MSVDYAAGSRAQLPGIGTGSTALAVIGIGSPPPGGFSPGRIIIDGLGHPNRPPQAVVSMLNAKKIRVQVGVSGNGVSASFDEVLEVGLTGARGEVETESGEAVRSLHHRWAWHENPNAEGQFMRSEGSSGFDLLLEKEGGEKQEILEIKIFTGGAVLATYYPSIDKWELFVDGFTVGAVRAADDEQPEQLAIATANRESGTVPGSGGIKIFGVDLPLVVSEGTSVSGSITVDEWLPTYQGT